MATIHLSQHPARGAAGKHPLLFVHGGFVNSRCWEFHFLPFFCEQGHDCFTLDLSGHGLSDGHDQLDELGLDHYVHDLKTATTQIGCPAVLIGHSMGARIVERHLRQGGTASAAILMAPVPASGTAASAITLSLRHPGFYEAIQEVLSGNVSEHSGALLTRIYFSPAVTPQMAERYLPMIGRESSRALAELLLPEFGWPTQTPKPPTLVVGGGQDQVFPASMLGFTALAWSADVHCEPEAGHLLMLDPQWANIAQAMLGWIDAKTVSNQQAA
ncbi:MAG: alpha/beta hydrolase [Burkholderiaceae bacterium]|nr:alpha/beta hydrolase [Burkholderiaceae bacterium]